MKNNVGLPVVSSELSKEAKKNARIPLIQDLIDSRLLEHKIKNDNFGCQEAVKDFKDETERVSKFVRNNLSIGYTPKGLWQPDKFNPLKADCLSIVKA